MLNGKTEKQLAQGRKEKVTTATACREKKRHGGRERNGQKAAETRAARERTCRTRRTRGVRPELDRIGELVITEAGDSPGTSAGLPRVST